MLGRIPFVLYLPSETRTLFNLKKFRNWHHPLLLLDKWEHHGSRSTSFKILSFIRAFMEPISTRPHNRMKRRESPKNPKSSPPSIETTLQSMTQLKYRLGDIALCPVKLPGPSQWPVLLAGILGEWIGLPESGWTPLPLFIVSIKTRAWNGIAVDNVQIRWLLC